jgi:hypothetical protein
VDTQAECEKACKTLEKEGLSKFYSASSWDYSPKCFLVLSGNWKGNCHWNLSPKYLSYSPDNREVCRGPGHGRTKNIFKNIFCNEISCMGAFIVKNMRQQKQRKQQQQQRQQRQPR